MGELIMEVKKLDLKGLKSPIPLFKVREALDKDPGGTKYIVLLTDSHCKEVIPYYINALGHRLIEVREEEEEGERIYKIVFITQNK